MYPLVLGYFGYQIPTPTPTTVTLSQTVESHGKKAVGGHNRSQAKEIQTHIGVTPGHGAFWQDEREYPL